MQAWLVLLHEFALAHTWWFIIIDFKMAINWITNIKAAGSDPLNQTPAYIWWLVWNSWSHRQRFMINEMNIIYDISETFFSFLRERLLEFFNWSLFAMIMETMLWIYLTKLNRTYCILNPEAIHNSVSKFTSVPLKNMSLTVKYRCWIQVFID